MDQLLHSAAAPLWRRGARARESNRLESLNQSSAEEEEEEVAVAYECGVSPVSKSAD